MLTKFMKLNKQSRTQSRFIGRYFVTVAMLALFFAPNARAVFEPISEFGITAGLRSTNVDVDSPATSSGGSGLQFGGLAFIPFSDALKFRTGFLYSQKYFSTKTGSVTKDAKFTYLDIPLTLMYKFSDFGGVFVGPILSMNQSKDCSDSSGATGNCTGVSSSLTPISFGASFKFAPQVGGEFVYEMASGSVATGVSNMRALGANVIVFFE